MTVNKEAITLPPSRSLFKGTLFVIRVFFGFISILSITSLASVNTELCEGKSAKACALLIEHNYYEDKRQNIDMRVRVAQFPPAPPLDYVYTATTDPLLRAGLEYEYRESYVSYGLHEITKNETRAFALAYRERENDKIVKQAIEDEVKAVASHCVIGPIVTGPTPISAGKCLIGVTMPVGQLIYDSYLLNDKTKTEAEKFKTELMLDREPIIRKLLDRRENDSEELKSSIKEMNKEIEKAYGEPEKLTSDQIEALSELGDYIAEGASHPLTKSARSQLPGNLSRVLLNLEDNAKNFVKSNQIYHQNISQLPQLAENLGVSIPSSVNGAISVYDQGFQLASNIANGNYIGAALYVIGGQGPQVDPLAEAIFMQLAQINQKLDEVLSNQKKILENQEYIIAQIGKLSEKLDAVESRITMHISYEHAITRQLIQQGYEWPPLLCEDTVDLLIFAMNYNSKDIYRDKIYGSKHKAIANLIDSHSAVSSLDKLKLVLSSSGTGANLHRCLQGMNSLGLRVNVTQQASPMFYQQMNFSGGAENSNEFRKWSEYQNNVYRLSKEKYIDSFLLWAKKKPKKKKAEAAAFYLAFSAPDNIHAYKNIEQYWDGPDYITSFQNGLVEKGREVYDRYDIKDRSDFEKLMANALSSAKVLQTYETFTSNYYIWDLLKRDGTRFSVAKGAQFAMTAGYESRRILDAASVYSDILLAQSSVVDGRAMLPMLWDDFINNQETFINLWKEQIERSAYFSQNIAILLIHKILESQNTSATYYRNVVGQRDARQTNIWLNRGLNEILGDELKITIKVICSEGEFGKNEQHECRETNNNSGMIFRLSSIDNETKYLDFKVPSANEIKTGKFKQHPSYKKVRAFNTNMTNAIASRRTNIAELSATTFCKNEECSEKFIEWTQLVYAAFLLEK